MKLGADSLKYFPLERLKLREERTEVFLYFYALLEVFHFPVRYSP